jgi:hypothetical protein
MCKLGSDLNTLSKWYGSFNVVCCFNLCLGGCLSLSFVLPVYLNHQQHVTFRCAVYVHITVHHKSMYLEDEQDAVPSSLYLFYCQVTTCFGRLPHPSSGVHKL